MEKQSTHERVLHFINLIKGHKNHDGHDAHEIMEKINMRGNCYMFAKTIQFVFPEAILYVTKEWGGHAAAYIDGKLYDIKGEITKYSRWTPDDFIPMDKKTEEFAATWCYSHKWEGSYGLHDKNGNRIEKLEELVLDSQNNSWKIPVAI